MLTINECCKAYNINAVETEDDNMRPIISYKQFSITWNPLAEDNYENLQEFCDKHNFPANTVFLKYDKENTRNLKDARDVIVFKKTNNVSQWVIIIIL